MPAPASAIPAPPLDVARLRGDFPILARRVHDRPLVYLDSAATAQKPRAVLDAIDGFYARSCANIHRGVHQLSVEATAAYERARERVARLLGAARAEEIVFVRSATEAVNLVAQSFCRPRLGPGDEILVTAMEHHSNIVPWQLVCAQTGAALRVLPMDDRGALRLDALPEALGPRTRLLAVAHVSNALGTINPIGEIVRIAAERDVPVLVDGAQAAPHLALDVAALGCAFYAISGHKAYGPTGIGALYGRRELLEAMPPYQGGGEMIRTVTFEHTDYADPPHRFEAGTPHVAGAIGLGAAADYLLATGLERIAAHEHALLERATTALAEIPRLRLVGTAPDKAAVVSFALEGVHPHDVGTILDHEGIAVRTGHHCAQPAHRHFGLEATTRASFGLYTTADEVDALARGLAVVAETFA